MLSLLRHYAKRALTHGKQRWVDWLAWCLKAAHPLWSLCLGPNFTSTLLWVNVNVRVLMWKQSVVAGSHFQPGTLVGAFSAIIQLKSSRTFAWSSIFTGACVVQPRQHWQSAATPRAATGQSMGLAIRNVCCCCVGLLIIMIIMWTAYDSAVRNYYHILAPTVHWLPDTLMMPEPCMAPTFQHRLAVRECDKRCWRCDCV